MRVIYKEDCSCGTLYIGETKHNVEDRWNELNSPTKSSEPSRHLWSNINHCFTYAVISNAPKIAKTRKSLEASYIILWKPDLNEQKCHKQKWQKCEQIVSHRAINDRMQTPSRETDFFFFSVCCIVFKCSWQLMLCKNVFI